MPPQKGRAHVLRIVRELLTRTAEGKGTDWAAGLEFMNRVLRRRAVVFLVSDFLTPVDPRAFRITSRRHDLVALWSRIRARPRCPPSAASLVEDLETGRTRALDTNNARARESYRAARADSRARVKRALAAAHTSAVPLSTAESYLPPLLRFFNERRKGRR